MEDTLRDKVMNAMNNFSVVLILVLMEDTLRVSKGQLGQAVSFKS